MTCFRMANSCGAKLGMDRREFLKTSSGMAAFLAMNSVYGKMFDVSEAEAATPLFLMDARPRSREELNHFGYDGIIRILNDPRIPGAARMVRAVADSGLRHCMVSPGLPGWMHEVERALDEQPRIRGWTLRHSQRHPFRLDDEKLMYPFYTKTLKAGVNIIGVYKGLVATGDGPVWGLADYHRPLDVINAAKDWPQLNFVVYHSCFRWGPFHNPELPLAFFNKTGEVEWCSELAKLSADNGISNVYGEIGVPFAMTAITNPRLTAAILGVLIKGLGASHVLWGAGFVSDGSPQWQIEAMRRLEIPEDMKGKYGFAPLGGADSMVKRQILGLNAAHLYGIELRPDRGGSQ